MSNFKLNIISGRMLFIILGIGMFVLIAYMIYAYYVKPRMHPKFIANKEFHQPTQELKEVNMILFYTEWCPHSQRALKVWNTFEGKHRGLTINGHKVQFVKYDCDKHEDKADEFNIQGYPTIKLVKENGEIIEFDAKAEEETLMEFLQTTLN